MKKRSRIPITIFLPALLLISLAGIFFFRAPVLIVSDQYFQELYGSNRTIFSALQSSLRLFRIVKTVSVPNDISSAGIAFAVSEAAANPFCVYFPYRYADAAKNYHDQFPFVNILLFAGKEKNPALQEDFTIVQTDTETDLYRAGFSAAMLSRGKDGKILCYIDKNRTTDEKRSFLQGIADGGREGESIFIDLAGKYENDTAVSCIVLTGSSEDPFITKQTVPIILFSWANPQLFSPQVSIVFSDSPWETAVSAIKTLPNKESLINAASRIHLHPQNNFSFKEKRELRDIFFKTKPQ
jgi:hypothetical protein